MLVVLLQLLLQEYSYSERISLLAAVAMESVGMSDRVIATYHLDNPEKMIGHDGDLWRYFESYNFGEDHPSIHHRDRTLLVVSVA